MSIRPAFSAALAAMLLGVATGGCAQPTPQEQQAEQIRDTAEAQADSVEAAAEDRAAKLEAEAEAMLNQTGQGGNYDVRRAEVYADAKRADARLVREQAEAQARAIRDAGQAKASALLAK